MDDEYYEPGVFFGFGGCHDLNDRDAETPRLLGMRSVSNGAAWALHKGKPPPKSRRMGFNIRSIQRGR